MTRRAYLNERQRAYRWRAQLETALARIDKLLAERPSGPDAEHGTLPELPESILSHFELSRPHGTTSR